MGTAQGTAPGATTAGQLGQAANPQMADPMQNMNNRGLPNMRRPPASGQPAMLPGGVPGAQGGQINPIRQLTQLPGGRPGGVSNPTWGAPGVSGGQISPMRPSASTMGAQLKPLPGVPQQGGQHLMPMPGVISQQGGTSPGASNFMSLDKMTAMRGLPQPRGISQPASLAPQILQTMQGRGGNQPVTGAGK